jgi:hypothetical protein
MAVNIICRRRDEWQAKISVKSLLAEGICGGLVLLHDSQKGHI